MHRIVILAALLLLPACSGSDGSPLLRSGGQYSGVPDSTVGSWPRPLGTLSTGGAIRLNREQAPRL